MNKQLENIKKQLQNIALVEGENFSFDEKAIDKEILEAENNKSSLAIKILSIFGGILASSAFVGFLALIGLYKSKETLLILGVLSIVAAFIINKKSEALFLDTFSIAIYIIGFMMLFIGMEGLNYGENAITLVILSIALVSVYLGQNYLLSFISFLIISGSLLAFVQINEFDNLIHLLLFFVLISLVYVFFNEAKLISGNKKIAKVYYPLRVALIISYLVHLMIFANTKKIGLHIDYVWIPSITIFGTFIFTLHKLMKIFKINDFKISLIIYGFSLLLFVATFFAPAINGTILIIILCFYVNYKTGFVLGIISLMYFISQFYYDLNLTLLTKSIMLFVSGILFISLYLFTKKILKDEKI